jgi:alpha-beta hydrolase superfamily lysophospholipase
MASLVQDVWLDRGPRLRARRLAPWEEPAVRVVFCLDRSDTFDDPPLVRFLERLAERLEVVAWELRGQGASAGHFGPEVLDDTRSLVEESPARWGADRGLVLGGHGLGGWLALAAADLPGVTGAFSLAGSLEPAGPPSSPLRELLASLARRGPLAVPTLLIAPRDQPPGDEAATRDFLAREPHASGVVPESADVLSAPWDDVVRAWAKAVGSGAKGAR